MSEGLTHISSSVPSQTSVNTLFQHLQWKKRTAVPYFYIFNNIRPQTYLILAF